MLLLQIFAYTKGDGVRLFSGRSEADTAEVSADALTPISYIRIE
jgi:hypothetical protein